MIEKATSILTNTADDDTREPTDEELARMRPATEVLPEALKEWIAAHSR